MCLVCLVNFNLMCPTGLKVWPYDKLKVFGETHITESSEIGL